MDDTPSHHVVDGIHDPAANYSILSVIAHWFGASAVIFLFLTHEGEWLSLHVSVGFLLAIPLLARVIYRFFSGFPRPVDQHPSLNLLSRLVMIGMLLSILVTTLTGALIPLFAGDPYTVFDYVSWSAPYGGNDQILAILDETHDIAGHAIVPLFVLHLVGFLKHLVFNRRGNLLRMIKSFRGGK